MKGSGKGFKIGYLQLLIRYWVIGKEDMYVDWFEEKREVLDGPIRKCNELHAIWLSSQRDIDKRRYVTQRRLVAQMVRKTKIEWFQQKVQQIEK